MVLHMNNFEFAGQHYLQVGGTAMGRHYLQIGGTAMGRHYLQVGGTAMGTKVLVYTQNSQMLIMSP